MNDASELLRIELLGPLSAHFNGTPVVPSAAKQRQVLALLALNAGRVVTVSTLIEELWADRPPRSYSSTLQTYILQLRNILAAALPGGLSARQLLSTRHNGYLLDDQACRTDVNEFRRLARAGRSAAEMEDHIVASEQLGRALQLWRGPALVDVRMGGVLELEANSLEQTRLGVFERRVEADLALGRHADLLGELTMAVARSPMNENLCAFLMLTFYQSGYVGRALEAFRRLRTVLRDELGVEPCPRLQRLQMAILSGDAALEAELPTSPWLRAGSGVFPAHAG